MIESSVGGIILCGGRSSRMGRPKHLLPFGKEVLLQRIVRIVSSAVSPVVVVAAPEQELPALPDEVELVRDPEEHLGPLAGLCGGLRALQGRTEAAYLTGCDVPLLKTEFIKSIIDRMGPDDDAVVPFEERFLHPLAAVYRCRMLPLAEELLANGELRPRTLIERCRSQRIPVDELRVTDPELDSLRNMNSPDDYAAILARAGLRND